MSQYDTLQITTEIIRYCSFEPHPNFSIMNHVFFSFWLITIVHDNDNLSNDVF